MTQNIEAMVPAARAIFLTLPDLEGYERQVAAERAAQAAGISPAEVAAVAAQVLASWDAKEAAEEAARRVNPEFLAAEAARYAEVDARNAKTAAFWQARVDRVEYAKALRAAGARLQSVHHRLRADSVEGSAMVYGRNTHGRRTTLYLGDVVVAELVQNVLLNTDPNVCEEFARNLSYDEFVWQATPSGVAALPALEAALAAGILALAALRAPKAPAPAPDDAPAIAAALEVKRSRDMATIRAQWRTIGTASWWCRSRNGSASTHPQAVELLRRILAAQERADILRLAREVRERAESYQRPAAAPAAARPAALAGFGMGNAFAGLSF